MRWCVSLLVFGLTILPVLLLSPFPTQDGPSHLYAGHVLSHLGEADYPALNQAFEYSSSAISTWTVHGAIAVLQDFCPTILVEKIVVLSFLVLLFAVFAVGAKDFLLFPVCALPLYAMSFPLRMGFFSFCLSMPLALLAVAMWTGVNGGRQRQVAAACLVAFMPFLHLLATAWALVLMGAGTMAAVVSTRRVDGRELAMLGVASIPLLVLVVGFPGSSAFAWESFAVRLAALMAGGAIVGAGPYALWWSSAPSLALLVLALLFLRSGPRPGATGGASLCRIALVLTALVVALFAPEEGAGGAYVGVRYNLLFFLLLLFLFRSWPLPRRADAAIAAFFLLFSVSHLSRTHAMLEAASAAEREIAASASILEEHTSLLVVVAGEWLETGVTLASQVRPLLHAGELLGVGADRTVLTFYQGELRYFPVNFRRESTPFGVLFDRALFEWGAPEVNWDALATWRGGVDYIGVWDEAALLRSPRAASGFARAIGGKYREAYRSDRWPWVIYRLERSMER